MKKDNFFFFDIFGGTLIIQSIQNKIWNDEGETHADAEDDDDDELFCELVGWKKQGSSLLLLSEPWHTEREPARSKS